MFFKYLPLFILPLCGISTSSEDTNVIQFCNEQLQNRRLLLVSTLDGRLTALDINNEGVEKWSVITEPGPLLSSTIHQLEVQENKRSVRIIPALSGGLYKFDGDFIEPIPVSVDSLLKSYSDDVDISGGKEVRSYAVEIETGKVLYHCSMNECSNWTDNTYVNYDMMLIRRETQICRAVEPQTRVERWNYTVGLHNVSISQNEFSKCLLNSKDSLNIDVKVVVPKGLLSVINKSDSNNVLWEHQFSSPVVNVWQLSGNRLESINVFKSAGIVSAETKLHPKPLYIGMHDKQWYIQESEPIHRTYAHDKPLLAMKKWKLIHAVESDSDRNVPQITDESGHNATTALTQLYDLEAVNGEGFYLYCVDKKGDCTAERSGIFSLSVFMNWWKEAAVFTIVSLLLINYMLPCPNLSSFTFTEIVKGFLSKCRSSEFAKESAVEATNSKQDSGISGVSVFCNTTSEYETSKYRSRYLEDFEPIHCLGKGGFGVVFQARNKIDDCHYAIKRITLPNKEEARERVMREVKALAKLEHQHIVRYFQAWQECPPVGWQEEQDKLWKDKTKEDYLSSGPEGMTSSFTSSPSHLHSSYLKNTVSSSDAVNNYEITYPVQSSGGKNDSFSVVFQKSNNSAASDTPLKGNQYDDSSSYDEEKKDSSKSVERNGRRKSISKTSKVYLYIQMQLCQKNSLQKWLCDNSIRDSITILNIFDQIVQAVEYVHLQALIHRDLKPSNIFFSPDGQIKVGDFGLVTEMMEDTDYLYDSQGRATLDETRTANVGTKLYMSPEQKMGKPYNYKVDIYSLGIILFELLNPFATEMERHRTLDNLRNNEFPKDFNIKYEDEYNLLNLMLSETPEERPTTIGIRARPPLSKFRPSDESTQDWHFELPLKHCNSNILRKSSSEVA